MDPLLELLKTLHLEVQYEGKHRCLENVRNWIIFFHCRIVISAIELIKDLMEYDIRDQILFGLVNSLKPTKEELILSRPDVMTGKSTLNFHLVFGLCAQNFSCRFYHADGGTTALVCATGGVCEMHRVKKYDIVKDL